MKNFAFALALLLGSGATAQQNTTGPTLPSTPTTKVLAVGHMVSDSSSGRLPPVMTDEVRDTVRLYLAGKIDQWYVRKDQRGVVFVMNVTSVEEARSLLETLPLGRAKLMVFDFIPIGPLSPLGLLTGPTNNPASGK